MAAESPMIERAAEFIWRQARLVDRQRFAHLFLGAPAAPVISALRAYQNADGGFGNGLEPDKRCPDSQPVDVEVALHVLNELGDDFDWRNSLVEQVISFLTSITTPDGGIPRALPTVLAYPRAPWWDAEENPPASLNPTAGIVGLLLKHRVQHPWVESTAEYCWRAITVSATEEVHEIATVLTFLQNAPNRPRAQREFDRISERIFNSQLVELDPDATGYVKKPLDWAPSPDSWCRRLFDDRVIDAHLDALAERQEPDGGWTISWPPLSPLVELEWRGYVTVEALKTLRAYGRA